MRKAVLWCVLGVLLLAGVIWLVASKNSGSRIGDKLVREGTISSAVDVDHTGQSTQEKSGMPRFVTSSNETENQSLATNPRDPNYDPAALVAAL